MTCRRDCDVHAIAHVIEPNTQTRFGVRSATWRLWVQLSEPCHMQSPMRLRCSGRLISYGQMPSLRTDVWIRSVTWHSRWCLWMKFPEPCHMLCDSNEIAMPNLWTDIHDDVCEWSFQSPGHPMPSGHQLRISARHRQQPGDRVHVWRKWWRYWWWLHMVSLWVNPNYKYYMHSHFRR